MVLWGFGFLGSVSLKVVYGKEIRNGDLVSGIRLVRQGVRFA